MTTRDGAPDTMSTGQLVGAIKDDLTDLVRSEIELAKAELRESAASMGLGGALVAAAGFLLALVAVLLSVALAFGLVALGLGPGWAFLIVAGGYLLVAAVCGLVARGRFRQVHGPERARQAAVQVSEALRPRRRT